MLCRFGSVRFVVSVCNWLCVRSVALFGLCFVVCVACVVVLLFGVVV